MEFDSSISNTTLISLLHATWHREGGPREVREAWTAAATYPDRIEYICAMDSDDTTALEQTEGCLRTINDPLPVSSAVRNWNSAAQISTGLLLVVIADDLFPSAGWDMKLLELASRVQCDKHYAIKVRDTEHRERHGFMRHPVVNREYYTRFGLFSSNFSHLYVDTDFSLRAFWSSVVINGQEIHFTHRHPLEDTNLGFSQSQARGNAAEERKIGALTYEARWPGWKRWIGVRPVSARMFNKLGQNYGASRLWSLPGCLFFAISKSLMRMEKKFIRRRKRLLRRIRNISARARAISLGLKDT